MNIYKIRRKSDGKYSAGSKPPVFTNAGVYWHEEKKLRNHLLMFRYGNWDAYNGCEIVEFSFKEEGISSISINEIMELYKDDEIIRRLKSNG